LRQVEFEDIPLAEALQRRLFLAIRRLMAKSEKIIVDVYAASPSS
jgi:hypothetical protein